MRESTMLLTRLTNVPRCIIIALLCVAASVRAGDLDVIGVTLLRKFDPALRGDGVHVAHVEPPVYLHELPPFEVEPSVVGQPASLFTYISELGTAGTFTNNVGLASFHANLVGGNFYGATNGPAPQVSHVDNYEAGHFFNNLIAAASPPNIPGRVVNQSFIFDPSEAEEVDQQYDDYAFTRNVLFVSGVGNGGPVNSPGTCYNGLGAALYGAPSSVGPAPDGRSKPDITAPNRAQAPGSANSYSVPYVSGCAALLLQAALRGDGGTNTNAAADIRTIKALLMNGAVKPADWTNGLATPLDARYGSGIVNIFNSWQQLLGGQHSFIQSTTMPGGEAHPPGSSPNNVPALVGWDHNSISTLADQDRVHHYYFNVPGTDSRVFAATLVWHRHSGEATINNLDLFLYNAVSGHLVLCSTSLIDNVEHIFVPRLPPGRYDLQVLKTGPGQVTGTETYSLAFAFVSPPELAISATDEFVRIAWPVFPDGWILQSSPSLNSAGSWTTVNAPVTVDTNLAENLVLLPPGATSQFFRLRRP